MSANSSGHNSLKSSNFGCYMEDGKRKVDMVMVYEEDTDKKENPDRDSEENENRRSFFQNNLKREGLELEQEIGQDGEKTFVAVKIHAPWTVLCKYAEELRIKTPLKIKDQSSKKKHKEHKHKELWQKIVDKVSKANVWGHKTLSSVSSTTSMNEVDKTVINWPFKRKRIERYAADDQDTFFVERQRIEIVWEILQKVQNDADDSKKRGIEGLLEHKIYETVYPLHNGDLGLTSTTPAPQWTTRQRLKATWANWSTITQMQPLWDVRNYFGEKIGFYFAFMDSYTRWLTVPSLFGLIVFFIGVYYASSHPELRMICESQEHHHDTAEHDSAEGTTASGGTSNGHSGHQYEEGHGSSQGHSESAGGVHDSTTGHPAASEDYSVADLWMCPICAPPNCDIWEMWYEGCSQYKWAFTLDNEYSIALSCIVILWSILFLKCWRRRESKLAVDWDTHDAEDNDMIIRPNYEERAPSQRKNPITLETEPYVPGSKRCMWMCASVMATLLMLIFATCCLLALVMSRIALYGVFKHIPLKTFEEKNVEWARWSVHGLIFVTVSIFESFYHWVAHKLTEYECPKTDNQFLSSLLWKVFIFEMMNDFVPIAYAAWVKGKVWTPLNLGILSELCDGGCIGEVTELVAVLLLARLVVGNTMEVGVPFIKHAYKEYVEKKEREHSDGAEQKRKPQWHQDFNLEEVELDGVYDEYMEMMIQFSFIVFFSPALPVAPFLCFLNNVVEIRVDAINMLIAHRRPIPIRVPGIQIWNSFMDIIIKLGIIINAGLIAFTSDNIPRLYYKYIVSPGHGILGFTRFSLSTVPISQFKDKADTMKNHTDEVCYYPDWKESFEPYNFKSTYYQILTIRVAAFAGFCMAFFIVMWFLNTFIDDVPLEAKTKMQRRTYIVTKAMEAETAVGKSTFTGGNKHKMNAKHNDVVETNLT